MQNMPSLKEKKGKESINDAADAGTSIASSTMAMVPLNDGNETATDQQKKEGKNKSTTIATITPAKHMLAIMALCLVMLTHGYLLISVFPYSGFMAIELIPSVNEETAGSYAGLIASSFMAARSLTSFQWGKWADTYGRKSVLFLSLTLSCVFTTCFSLAPTFGWALFFRACLGLSNGLVGTAKTLVSELAGDDKKLETRSMGLVMGMWGWGFLIAPAVSGASAEPVKQYPNNVWLQADHPVIKDILSAHPFLLPNLVGACLCILTTLTVSAFVEETLPNRRSPAMMLPDLMRWILQLVCKPFERNSTVTEGLPLIADKKTLEAADYHSTDGTTSSSVVSSPSDVDSLDEDVKECNLSHSESCSMLATTAKEMHQPHTTTDSLIRRRSERKDESDTPAPATVASLWSRVVIRRHLLVYWFYSFVAVSIDEAFPLFCISKEAGLGLSEASIGKILSLSGLIFACCQYFIFANIMNAFGVYGSLKLGSILSSPIISLVPLSLYFNRSVMSMDDDDNDDVMTWSTYIFLGVLMAAYRIFGSVFFSSMSLAINRTVPLTHRGTMNGLSMLGGSFAKAFGPSFAGFLVAFCVSSGVFAPHVGAVAIFATIGILGSCVSLSSFRFVHPEVAEDLAPGRNI